MHRGIKKSTSKKDAQQISISIPPPDESYSDRRRFDKLLISLSARCMDSHFEELDREIEKCLKDVAEYFQVERISLWTFSLDGQEMFLTHFHSEVDAQPTVETLVYSDLPYIMERIHRREVIPVSSIDDLPASADIDRQTIQRNGVNALLAIPLCVRGSPIGALSLSIVKRAERNWSYGEIMQAQRIGEVIANSLDRKRSYQMLQERLQFETMFSDISARFVNISTEDIDREIDRSLEQILVFFQVEHCGLFEVFADRVTARIIHAANAPGIPPVPRNKIDISRLFPWQYKMIVEQGRTICIRRLDDLPEEAEIDRKTDYDWGVKSFVTIPVHAEGQVNYLISMATATHECVWPEEYIPRLRLLGQIFVTALARKIAKNNLRESEERLRDIIFNIADWVWEIDENGVYTYSSPKGHELIGHIIGKTPFDFMPLDEAKRVKAIFSEIVANKAPIKDIENWNIGKNGEMICFLTNGVPILDKEGNLKGYRGVDKDITERKKAQAELRKAYDEITNLKEQLEIENIYLRQEMNMSFKFDNFIGQSDVMKYVFFRIQQVASTHSTVLITGETGTGKGMVARAIHQASSRKDNMLVMVNCAALPSNLIESELFGREKGAFTGAHAAQIGRFELADKGTIFLDEIGELPLDLQAKLLRVIESGEFERLGSPHSHKVDVRIIASTNRDLAKEIHERRFREDLYYRLNVFPITIPPLRHRKEDIPMLVQYFVEKHCRRMGKQITSVPREVMNTLQKYPWPGNVRELENIIERSVIGTLGNVLKLTDSVMASHAEHKNNSEENIAFTFATPKGVTTTESLFCTERNHILKTLDETGWKIEGMKGAAQLLGLKPSTLRSRMKKLGIQKTTNH